MADKYVANSTIKHADRADEKSNVRTFSEGDTVSGLPKEQMERLIETGAVVKVKDYDDGSSRRMAPGVPSDLEKEVQDRDMRIEELEAKVAEQNKELEALKSKQSSGSTQTTQQKQGSGNK